MAISRGVLAVAAALVAGGCTQTAGGPPPGMTAAQGLAYCSTLTQTYGESSPMGLAWNFMGYSTGYNLFAAVPYVLTLVILVISCRPGKVAQGSPGELSSAR